MAYGDYQRDNSLGELPTVIKILISAGFGIPARAHRFSMIVVDWLPYLSSINHDHEKCLLMPRIERA
jgi:hypothetical protein